MHHILMMLKIACPDKFCEKLQVTSFIFNAIIAAIASDPIFQNFNNAQTSVEEQLTTTLYWFGHDGNAASLQGIAKWAGCGKGMVLLITQQVMAATLRTEFIDEAVKKWVYKHLCKAWHDGWHFVDRTLLVWQKLF